MSTLSENINDLKQLFYEELKAALHPKDLEKIKSAFLGKQGKLTLLFTLLKEQSLEEKRASGPLLQTTKTELEDAINKHHELLVRNQIEGTERKKAYFDVTAYQPEKLSGHLHPYSLLVEEIETIFMSLGYEVLDGPEVETDYYNFTALNIPAHHPARDMYDTFWLDVPGMLLRTHTSSVQAHALEGKEFPIAAIVPGRCFRHEATDASHDFMFMQCEGLLIDKNITLAHLFSTIQHFLEALFRKKNLPIRIRPGFFPFVEPGLEIDMQCPFCSQGCSVCKKTRWIEVFPAGLVHPQVLKNAGIDPTIYSGFAFGFGLTRLAMIRYAINDIRLFHSGKMKFLEQF